MLVMNTTDLKTYEAETKQGKKQRIFIECTLFSVKDEWDSRHAPMKRRDF